MATKEYFEALKLIHQKMKDYQVDTFDALPEKELLPVQKLMQYETKAWNEGIDHYEFIDFQGKVLFRTPNFIKMSEQLKIYFEKNNARGGSISSLREALKNNHGLTNLGYLLRVRN